MNEGPSKGEEITIFDRILEGEIPCHKLYEDETVLAFLDIAGRDGGIGEETRGYLGRAAEQGERVRRILRQLLEFSNPRRTDRVALDVGDLAQEAIGLVRAQRRYSQIGFEIDVFERR